MNKEVIIIGDIEMGGGTLTDDFISDQTLSRLIYSLCNRNVPVDLVLNGDTFDFLKNPHFINNSEFNPNTLTTEISFLNLKEEYPVLERIIPRPAIFSHHKAVNRIINRRVIEYFVKSLMYYPLRYYYDPTYTFPRELVREFYRRVKNVHWDVDEIVDTFKRKRRKALHRNKLYVFGHVHKRYLEEAGDIVIIHPDTWRDEYFLDTKTRNLIPKTKRYVQVTVSDDNTIKWKIINCQLNRSTIHFNDLVRDEKKYAKLAAEEEGYTMN